MIRTECEEQERSLKASVAGQVRILSCDWLIGYLALYWVASSRSDRNCFPAQWYGPSLWNVASNDLKIMIENQLHKRSEIFNKYLVLVRYLPPVFSSLLCNIQQKLWYWRVALAGPLQQECCLLVSRSLRLELSWRCVTWNRNYI